MAYAIETLTKGGGDDCHYQFLAALKTLAENNGWTALRYDTSTDNHELSLKSQGLSGTEEIYVGFQTYQSIAADYYNILCATFIGFESALPFLNQPGAKFSGCPAHNNAITYFVVCNAQRIAACLKVGTPVYEHFYVGKFFPYARPSEYPAPLVCASMFNGAETKRFDDTSQYFPYHGYYRSNQVRLYVRDRSGAYGNVWCYPFTNKNSGSNALGYSQGNNCMVPAGSYYQLEPIIMSTYDSSADPSNIFGELDQIFFCSGFNNNVENVVQMGGSSVFDQTGKTVKESVQGINGVGGRAFVMLQNVYRTAWQDFIAMEMK